MQFGPKPGSSASLSGLLALEMEIGGLCDNSSHEPRFVDPDTATLIKRYGPDALTEDVMRKIECSQCGNLVDMSVSASSVHRAVPGGRGRR